MDASKSTAEAAAGAAPRTPPPLPHLANGHASAAPAPVTAGASGAVEEGVGEGGGAAVVAGRSAEVDGFRHRVDEIFSTVNELEQRVSEVVQFYSSRKQPNNGSGTKGRGGGASLVSKEKQKERPVIAQKRPVDVARKDVVCTKRMQELMRQFGTILRQISQHKWAWPFMQPVDVEGLGLHDYYEVIKKPMDFDTIRTRMEVKDGSGYKNVREIYADVRLVFTNAMTYNDERHDIHQMAKSLLDKFEEKWLQLLPKVIEEETRQTEEEAKVQAEMQMAQEVAIAKMARDTDTELNELSVHLEELREMVLQRCRRMSAGEKRKLGVGLSRLSPEDLNRALEIIAQNNPSFQATAEEVDLDMDALSESTLWRLKFFVKEALEVQAKGSATKSQDNTKREREICDALAKTAKKRSRKLSDHPSACPWFSESVVC